MLQERWRACPAAPTLRGVETGGTGRVGVALALVVSALASGWGIACRPADVAVADPTTVVLVTVDTWRWDANGFLGGMSPSPTPFLDGLAAGGLVAVDAVAPVPLTAPSHWSVLAGRWPWRDGVRVNGEVPDEVRGPTLPELLRDAGWQTAGFVSCAVLDRGSGFAAGFEHFDDRFHASGALGDTAMAERRADRTVDAVLAWLDAEPGVTADERLLLWVHLFDPHAPYTPPGGPLPGPSGAYVAEVAFVDRQLERLAAALAERGRPLERSLWIVLSDHGEALGEHAEPTHGMILHGATTRIPLLLAGVGVPARRVTHLASTVDVVPTLLGRLALAAPHGDGVDLLGGAPAEDRAVPLESLMGARAFGLAPALGVRTAEWLWESSPRDHLWHVANDPAEQRDLAGSSRATVDALRARREAIGVAPFEALQPLDAATADRLVALGYLDAGSSPGSGDVRDFLRESTALLADLSARMRSGDYAGAESVAQRCLERYPGAVDVWSQAAFASVGLGDMAEAERRFRRALELKPDYLPARLNLANVLWKQSRLPEAERELRTILAEEPDDPHALFNLGALLAGAGHTAEAVPFWSRFRELYPDHPRAAAVDEGLAAWEAAEPRAP